MSEPPDVRGADEASAAQPPAGESVGDGMVIGAVLRLRKAHPCGSDTWRVVRVGADVGLRCMGCDRKILAPRARLARQVRAVVAPGDPPAGG